MKKTTNNTENVHRSTQKEDSFINPNENISQQEKNDLAGSNAILKDSILESQILLQQAQQITPLGTYNLDISSGIWVGNEILDHIFGIGAEYHKNFESWISILHPDWRERMTDYFRNEVLRDKTRFDKEYKIIRQNDQEERWVHGLGELILNDDQQPIYMIGTIYDITERKQEDGLLAAVEHTDNIVTVKDLDLRILAVNQAFMNASGHTSTKNIIGKTDAEVFGMSDAVRTYMEDEKKAQKLKPGEFILREEPLILPDGNVITILTRKYPIFNSEGKLVCTGNVSTDITVRKKAEEALWLKNLIFDTSIASNSITGLDGIVTDVNEAFLRNMRYQHRDEVIGKPMSYFLNNKDEAEAIDNVLKETGHWEGNYTAKRGDGSTFIAHALASVLYDKNSEIIGYQSSVNDITDLKQTEDALKESEEKYRTVADYTDDWEYWIDSKDNFLYCSPSCERITGYKATEFIQNPKLLFEIIYPVDQKIFQLHKQEQYVHHNSDELQFRIVRFGGEIRWIGHVCQRVYDEAGNCIGFRGSNRDITERKKTEQQLKNSEQKYKLLSENITDGVFISKKGYLEYTNKAMSHIFGYEEVELERFKFAQLIKPDLQDDFETFISVDSTTDKVNNLEIECVKKDYSSFFAEFYLNYVANEGAIYGVVHDITVKKQIQERNIVKATILTEEKERVNFSKELHDGLGPLLSIIKIYLQWSIRPVSEISRKEIILKAEDILEEALMTVKEISFKLSPHLLEYHGLTTAVQSFIRKIENTNTLKIDFQSNITQRIEMEIEAALYRAIIECINNTIKHAEAKCISIKLDYEKNHISLQYEDDGKGFDIEKTLTDEKGLGLYNLRNRIQTIGGDIKMISLPFKGVHYQISVPVKQTRTVNS